MRRKTFQERVRFTLLSAARPQWQGLKWIKGVIHAIAQPTTASTDAARLMVTTHGRSEVSWRQGRTIRRRVVEAGAVTFLDAGVQLDHVRSQGDYESFGIELDPVLIDRWTLHGSRRESLCVAQLPPHVVDHDPAVLRFARLMERAGSHAGGLGTLYAESLSLALLHHLWDRHARARPAELPNGLSAAKVVEIKDYLWEHLAYDVSLNDLAAIAGLSPRHFCTSFRRATGVSPYQYLLGARILRSKELLRQQPGSITEVAMVTGFSSSSHFASAFKNATSLTPSCYANSCGRGLQAP